MEFEAGVEVRRSGWLNQGLREGFAGDLVDCARIS